MTDQYDQVVEQFVERLGLVAQADGLPRIAGRIMGLLVIHGGPFSFCELSERLQVSRGSISTNSRLLENLGVIERVTRPGDRQDYFQIRPDPLQELLRNSLGRLQKASQMVAETQAQLPQEWTETQRRLGVLKNFYIQLCNITETAANNTLGATTTDSDSARDDTLSHKQDSLQ